MSLADTIFVNATVLTVDAAFTRAEAVAVADGRIVAVGTEADLLPLAGVSTAVVDCGGNTLLPGFVEAHGHPTAEMNMLGPASVDLRATACGSAEEVLGRLRAAIAGAGPDGWVTAFGWDPLLLPDLPAISGDFLSELSPDVPGLGDALLGALHLGQPRRPRAARDHCGHPGPGRVRLRAPPRPHPNGRGP